MQPFDNRLQYLVIKKMDGENFEYSARTPMDGNFDTDVYTFLMSMDVLAENLRANVKTDRNGNLPKDWKNQNLKKQQMVESYNDFGDKKASYQEVDGDKTAQDYLDYQERAIEINSQEYINKTQFAIMNPYAMVHLYGGVDSDLNNRLVDTSTKASWYEPVEDKKWSKNPTTERIIEWSKLDPNARTPYLFQDFVFCKWWNKIPNNRMITLRRYPNPILDNLNTPVNYTMSKLDDNIMFPPLCTLVTYFGDDTGNTLKNILKLSTGTPWGEAKAEVWDLTSAPQPSTNDVYNGAFSGLGLGFGNFLATMTNAMGVLSGGDIGNGLEEKNGIPPDPYKDGPYSNRVQGVVNRIDAVKKRDPGINFTNEIKLKFDYVARPIGGINSKAVMLDILANILVMGSPTAIFFGGAHRSRIPGRRFPANNDPALQKLYQGKLFGEDGAINAYAGRLKNLVSGCGGVMGLLTSLFDAAKGLLGDLIGSITGATPPSFTTDPNDGNAIQMKAGMEKAITEKMRAGMPVSYVSGMRALLTGDPVGDWHLTIGNPLNPIAMIGNLICTNIDIEIDEDAGLGPDDFPLGWSVTITLEHGMKRDRDAIESMFNFGNGRIYELPDSFQSSGDLQTKVDTATQNSTPTIGHERSASGAANRKSSKGEYKPNVLTGEPDKRGRKIKNVGHIFGIEPKEIDNLTRVPAVYIDEFTSKKSNK